MRNFTRPIPGYLARVPRYNPILRLAWWLTRRYCINEARFKITRLFTGPRPRGTSQVSTTKANATSSRYYFDRRVGK